MRPMNRYHRTVLEGLVAAGHGFLDNAGRVCSGPLKAPLPGDPIAWLVLVSNGLIAGERGLLIPTEAGREMVGTPGERTRVSQ